MKAEERWAASCYFMLRTHYFIFSLRKTSTFFNNEASAQVLSGQRALAMRAVVLGERVRSQIVFDSTRSFLRQHH